MFVGWPGEDSEQNATGKNILVLLTVHNGCNWLLLVVSCCNWLFLVVTGYNWL